MLTDQLGRQYMKAILKKWLSVTSYELHEHLIILHVPLLVHGGTISVMNKSGPNMNQKQ